MRPVSQANHLARQSKSAKIPFKRQAGLGIPLPAGTTALCEPRADMHLLLGFGLSPQIAAEQSGRGPRRHVTLTNANPFPMPIEVAIGNAFDANYKDTSAPLERIDGLQT